MQFLHKWLKRLRKASVISGESFNLDSQSLPYFGEKNVVEKHYVSMRSRRQKAILVFFAQDVKSKIFPFIWPALFLQLFLFSQCCTVYEYIRRLPIAVIPPRVRFRKNR